MRIGKTYIATHANCWSRGVSTTYRSVETLVKRTFSGTPYDGFSYNVSCSNAQNSCRVRLHGNLVCRVLCRGRVSIQYVRFELARVKTPLGPGKQYLKDRKR